MIIGLCWLALVVLIVWVAHVTAHCDCPSCQRDRRG